MVGRGFDWRPALQPIRSEREMPLITCADCGQTVSTSARACPNCGRPPKKRRGCIGYILMAIGAVIVILALLSFLGLR